MNDLIKYHDNDQMIEHNVVSFESQSEPHTETASSMFQGILRRWPVVLLTFILICAVGIPTIWFLVEPLYTVTGAVRVAPIIENIITGENETGGISNYQSYMNTQAVIITSTPVVQRVADDLADKNLSFFTDGSTNPLRKIKQKVSNATISSDPGIVLKQAIADRIITVAPANRTELMTISMKARKPEDARQVVDAFIRAYMEVELYGSTEKQRNDLTFLEREQKIWAAKMNDYKESIFTVF